MTPRRCILVLFAALLLTTSGAHARPGLPDPSFAGQGSEPAFVGFFGEDHVQDLFVRRDGKIVVAGTTVRGYGVALVRLRPDGQLDPTFGEDGRLTPRTALSGRPLTVVATPGPKDSIFVVLNGRISGDVPCCSWRTEVIKLKASGALDKTFGGDGRVLLAEPPYDARIVAALGRDGGSLLLAGSTHRGASTVRLERAVMIKMSSSGEIEPGPTAVPLGPQGAGNSAFTSLAAGHDGTVIAAGHVDLTNGVDAPTAAMLLTRFTANDAPDTTFGVGGAAVAMFDEGAARASDVIVDRTGSITVAGTATYSNSSLSSPAVVLARLKPDGTLDEAFGGDGRSAPLKRQAMAVSLLPRSTGAIAVAIDQGGCTNYACGVTGAHVIGVTAKGKLDRAFGLDGFARVSRLFQGGLRLAAQGDEIIVAGTGLNEPESSCAVDRPCFIPRQGNDRPYDFAVDRLAG